MAKHTKIAGGWVLTKRGERVLLAVIVSAIMVPIVGVAWIFFNYCPNLY